MNKKEAKQYAKRYLHGVIEQITTGIPIPKEPLVYDCYCKEEAKGRRLSPKNSERVWMAIYQIQQNLARGSCSVNSEAKPDGKPGAKWKGYKDLRKRQGYETP